FGLAAGERIRLRLVNAANARIFALDFQGHDPVVIALDGHPLTPHKPANGRIVLGPAMRADILLDATGEPGRRYPVVDDFYPRRAYRLLDLTYSVKRARGHAGTPLPNLAANPVAEPDIATAERHLVRFEGGMMGRMPMTMRDQRRPVAWTVNGKAVLENDHSHEPILSLHRGRSYLLELVNDTA